MLKEALIVQTSPKANEENIVIFENYRVTVLADRLFRIEKRPNGVYNDEATQAVWFRDMEKQNFSVNYGSFSTVIDTGVCKLFLYKNEGQVCVEIDGKKKRLDNYGNLLGTYRTLDCYDGDTNVFSKEKVKLGQGVCSKTGVAVLEDDSLRLGADGQVKYGRLQGSDKYVFAYGDDYQGAVKALYMLTGKTPLVPRFALGNWWSRYHDYTDKEYLQLLNIFEERNVPLTVATIDMDWHYSVNVDKECKISESGKNSPEYVGNNPWGNVGWTGYTWNENLFPDYKGFLQKVKDKNVKITLNVHPSDGVRFWEACYENMASALGKDASEQKQLPFDFTYDRFINCYFDLVHKPYELEGVDFWWIDWQQPNIPWHDAEKDWEDYDPLWALNHYHYLDNGEKKNNPLILSRYAGIGSHRYPLGFSGDTMTTWKTLAYFPYFTATATNIGYTWWSHDIGGHCEGEKSNELYVRHVQYGVFSPINRLHCTAFETMSKEPWVYGNGAGLIAEHFLRFRHRLIPYLYTAAYQTNKEGIALVQPLYYTWKQEQAYAYKTEYTFGSQLLVAPVISKGYADGYARVKAWIPEGKWTDIFTGEEYEVGEEGKEITLLRTLDSIPVLAKAGGILPLSSDVGNGVTNPAKLEIWVYEGNGEYTLYEDGREEGNEKEFFTDFTMEYSENEGACTQVLTISAQCDPSVIPENREYTIRFKNIEDGEISVYANGEKIEAEVVLSDCATARFAYDADKAYKVEVVYNKQTKLEKWKNAARKALLLAEEDNRKKNETWVKLKETKTEEEFLSVLAEMKLAPIVKLKIEEVL